MKSLKDYILLEKLKINKDSKLNDTYDIIYPKVSQDRDTWDEKEVWRKINFPNKKYVIFKDMYRGNRMHFTTIGDLIIDIAVFQNDYEDFNPEKDIYFASDSLKETIDWYIDKLGISNICNKYNNPSDLMHALNDKYPDWYKNPSCLDSIRFISNISTGYWNENDIMDLKENEYKKMQKLDTFTEFLNNLF